MPTSNQPDPVARLCQLELASLDEIKKVILKSPSKSCGLGPIATWLLKDTLNEVAPLIQSIVNASLQSGIVPDSMKRALVTILLKKPSLDQQLFKNYRLEFPL